MTINTPRTRRTTRAIATAGSVIVGLRVALWFAKIAATAGTVDTALEILGLHGPVDAFEDAVDTAIAPFVIALEAGWRAFRATLDATSGGTGTS